jgi:hypothetical protein
VPSVRLVVSWFGMLAVVGCVVASMSMNYIYGIGLGRNKLESSVWGGLSVAFDALKAGGPIYLVSAWRRRQWARMAAGTIILPGVIVYGLLSALGFASESKGAVVGGREAVRAAYLDTERELQEQTTRRATLKSNRGPSEVEAAMGVVFARPLGVAERSRGTIGSVSRNCTRDDAHTREACVEVAGLRQELTIAVEAARVDGRIGQLHRQLRELRERGGTIEPNPQATLLSRLTLKRLSPDDVEGLKTIYMSLLVEVVSTFGLLFVIEREGRQKMLANPREIASPAPPATTTEGAPGQFVRACVRAAEGERLELGELYPAYARWCERDGLVAMDEHRFGVALQTGFANSGARVVRRAGKVYVHGVRIAE